MVRAPAGLMGLRAWLSGLLPHWGNGHPRLIRRTMVHCPRTGAPVEIDLLMKETGTPDVVLRCSAHPECPPACNQACRELAEAVVGAPLALIIAPSGSGPPEEVD